ncbi:MAG TPA: VWA domain-containing protein [Candidatus Lokiarchaeia archaeon]|nr:VWA domain-containing protein [Candidatus Lokiarchaeia archaeon]
MSQQQKENSVPYWTYLLEKDVKSARKQLPTVLAYSLYKNLNNQFWLLQLSTPLDIRDALRTLQEYKHVTARVKRAVNRALYALDAQKLQMWLLRYSADAFREIFDVTHPKPSAWPLDWFQAACYGGPVPPNSVIAKARALKGKSAKEAAEVVQDQRIPWHYVRSKDQTVDREVFQDKNVTAALLKSEGMRFIVDNADKIAMLSKDDKELVQAKIFKAAQGKTKMNFVEPLLAARNADPFFRPAFLELAQSLLEKSYVDESKIGEAWVVGDVSGSMSVTIAYSAFVATIFAARLPEVRLFLFNTELKEIAAPKNVIDCMAICDKLRADGGTDIGVIFKYAVNQGHAPRTIVLVTDGEDNQPPQFQDTFAQFSKYVEQERVPVRIVYLLFNTWSKIQLPETEFIRVIQKQLDRDYAKNIDEILAEITYGEPDTSFWDKFDAVSLAFTPKIVVDECAICGKPLESDVIPLACGHKYHGACLSNYWDLVGKKQCVCHCPQTHKCQSCGAPVDATQEQCHFCKVKFVL